MNIGNNLHKVGCVLLSKLTFTGSAKNGGSGRVRVLRPDPTRQGLDPTRPAAFVNITDPTRPNPTRPAGRPDPGTTLGVHLDEKLKCHTHLNYISHKIAKGPRMLGRVSKILSSNFLRTLYYTLIYPYLNYCPVFFELHFSFELKLKTN